MHICFVGNSHVAALLRSTRQKRFDGDHTFGHFVVPGGGGPRLRVENNRLFYVSMGLAASASQADIEVSGFDLNGYDAIIYCAAGLPAQRLQRPDHVLNQLVLGDLAPHGHGSHQVVSESVMSQCVAGALLRSPNIGNLALLRSIFEGPILAVTSPPPSDLLLTEPRSDLPTQYGDNLNRFLSWYFRTQIAVIESAAREADVLTLSPPEEIVAGGLMPEIYRHDTTWHANPAYGEMMMRRALVMLKRS